MLVSPPDVGRRACGGGAGVGGAVPGGPRLLAVPRFPAPNLYPNGTKLGVLIYGLYDFVST